MLEFLHKYASSVLRLASKLGSCRQFCGTARVGLLLCRASRAPPNVGPQRTGTAASRLPLVRLGWLPTRLHGGCARLFRHCTNSTSQHAGSLLGRAERVPARALSRGLATGGVVGIRWRAEGLRREAARHDDRHTHARALGRRWSGVGTRTADESAPTNTPPAAPNPPFEFPPYLSPLSGAASSGSAGVCVTVICILIGYFVCTGLSRAIGVVTNVTKWKYLRTQCSLYDDIYTFTY